MNVSFITFRSVTFAQRGEVVLRAAGIPSSLRRTPKWMEERGCGYCLKIKQEDIPAALGQLRQKAVPFRKVYTQDSDGKLEERVP